MPINQAAVGAALSNTFFAHRRGPQPPSPHAEVIAPRRQAKNALHSPAASQLAIDRIAAIEDKARFTPLQSG
jgi:hypothetical protein